MVLHARKVLKSHLICYFFCAFLMLYLAWLAQNRLHADAVHYLQLATYYSLGKFDLAISGHWSPMLPTLLAPLIALGFDPVIAGRLTMVFSGLMFFAGALFLLKKLGLTPIQIHICAWCIGLSSAAWSVAWITPDLLSSAIIFFALGFQIDRDWSESRNKQLLTGILWALGYYAKAFALPFGIFACAAIAIWKVLAHQISFRSACRPLIVTLVVLCVVVLPWVILISYKYERPTISTASRFARIFSAPNYSPESDGRLFQIPEKGRVSASESFDSRRPWSPFESFVNAKHQIKIIYRNTLKIFEHLKNYDFLSISVIALIFSTFLILTEKSGFRNTYSLPVLLLVYAILGLYWLTYCDDFRYFWVLLPFLLYSCLSLIAMAKPTISQFSLNGLAIFVAISFSIPQLRDIAGILKNTKPERAQLSYREIAQSLLSKDISGPLVGSSEISHRCSLFVAFFMQQPSYGHIPAPTANKFAESGANLVILNRNESLAHELKSDPRFLNLDDTLYSPDGISPKNELIVFKIIQ